MQISSHGQNPTFAAQKAARASQVQFGGVDKSENIPQPIKRWYRGAQELAKDNKKDPDAFTPLQFVSVMLQDLGQVATGKRKAAFEEFYLYQGFVVDICEQFRIDGQHLEQLGQELGELDRHAEGPFLDYEKPAHYLKTMSDSFPRLSESRDLEDYVSGVLHSTIEVGDSEYLVSEVMFAYADGIKSANKSYSEHVDDLIDRHSGASNQAGQSQPEKAPVKPKPTPSKDASSPAAAAARHRKHETAKIKKGFESLSTYSTDLIDQADKGRLRPALFREDAVERLIRMMDTDGELPHVRMEAESGEGKTYTARALAQKIHDDKVPDSMKDAVMYELDLNALKAGSKFRGDFEERVDAIFKEILEFSEKYPHRRLIMMVDEAHNLSRDDGNSPSLMEMLKSGLIGKVGSNVNLLLMSTPDDLQREGTTDNQADESRFQTYKLPSLSKSQKSTILKKRAMELQKATGVIIPPNIVNTVDRLTQRDVSHNFLRMANRTLELAVSCALGSPLEVAALRDRESELEIKQEYIEKNVENQEPGSVEFDQQARSYKENAQELKDVQRQIKTLTTADKDKPAVVLGESELYQAKAILTGNPFVALTEGDVDKMKNIKSDLSKIIIGQPEALDAVQEMVDEIIARSEFQTDDTRPVSGMLVGPTGTGKTMLAQTVADKLFNGHMVKLDMAEYSEAHTVSKLIGAPPGYTGHDDVGGSLCDKVRKNPYSVILFDEIEKAHPDVRNQMLQILEDGKLTDSHGRVVDFSKCLVLSTSNYQQKALRDMLQQYRQAGATADPEMAAELLKTQVKEKLTQKDESSQFEPFKPEQMRRFQYILPYNPLHKGDVEGILDSMSDKYNQSSQLSNLNLKVSLSKAAKSRLIELAGAQTVTDDSTQLGTMAGAPPRDPKYKDFPTGFTSQKFEELSGPQAVADSAILQSGGSGVRDLFDGVTRKVNKYLLENKNDLTPGTLTVDFKDGKFAISHRASRAKKAVKLSA